MHTLVYHTLTMLQRHITTALCPLSLLNADHLSRTKVSKPEIDLCYLESSELYCWQSKTFSIGLSTQGIFRKPGNSGRLRYLQTMFDSPECYGSQVTWSGCTVHDAATLLQRYLNYLPEPVVSYDLYYSFMHANGKLFSKRPDKSLKKRLTSDLTITIEKQYAKESDKIAAMQQLISQLPPENQYLLLYLLDLLHVFAANHDKTLMDAYCLALVLAPVSCSIYSSKM